MASINPHLINPQRLSPLLDGAPVGTLANVISVLAVLKNVGSDPPIESGSAEWGEFLLLSECIHALRVVIEQLADEEGSHE